MLTVLTVETAETVYTDMRNYFCKRIVSSILGSSNLVDVLTDDILFSKGVLVQLTLSLISVFFVFLFQSNDLNPSR